VAGLVVADVGESGRVPVPMVVGVPFVGEPVLGATVVVVGLVPVVDARVLVDGGAAGNALGVLVFDVV